MENIDKRPPIHEWALALAHSAAERSTCARLSGRRKRGAVALDDYNRIVSLGYNGVPRGFVHCTDVPCSGAMQEEGGSAQDDCMAVHSEINCIISAHDPKSIVQMFLTHSPCFKCALALANLPNLQLLVFAEEYGDGRGLDVLRKTKIRVCTVNPDGTLPTTHE